MGGALSTENKVHESRVSTLLCSCLSVVGLQWNLQTRDTMGPTILSVVERSSLSRRSNKHLVSLVERSSLSRRSNNSMGLKQVSFVERSSLSRRSNNSMGVKTLSVLCREVNPISEGPLSAVPLYTFSAGRMQLEELLAAVGGANAEETEEEEVVAVVRRKSSRFSPPTLTKKVLTMKNGGILTTEIPLSNSEPAT